MSLRNDEIHNFVLSLTEATSDHPISCSHLFQVILHSLLDRLVKETHKQNIYCAYQLSFSPL